MDFLLEGNEKQDLYDIVEKELFKSRVLYLNESISSYTINSIVGFIHHINLQDEKENLETDKRKPIIIHVNSYGGSVYDGFAIVSAIVNSKTPIITQVDGYAMSMGLAIFVAGHERKMSRFATLMYHELSSSLEGSREEIRRATEEYDRLQGLYDDFIIERSALTKEELKEHQSKVSDWYISAEVAKEKGLVTGII